MKKIIAIATALTVFAFVVGPGVAQGATVEELQAQIAALMVQINALNAQLATLTGAPAGVPAACSGITFTANLTVGSSGAAVKCLQAILNQSAATQVAATGVGSAGNETTYFGPMTKAAVVKYQTANAISPAAGYVGSITRAKLNTVLTGAAPVTPPATGAEGSIIATINGTPASGTELYLAQTGIGVAAVNVKATGSDVLVNRFDLSFAVRPWLYISGVTITDGTISKSMSVTSANTTEVTVGASYLVRVEGLGINIPKDTTKTLTVKVDGVSALPSGTTADVTVTLTIAASALRGVDGAGLSQYAPTGALTRTFTAKVGDTSNLELSAEANNLKERNLTVSDSGVTTGAELLRANVKATNNTAILRTVNVAVTGNDTPSSGTISAIYLYDGATILASTSSLTAASSTFEDVNLTIPKGTTKTLVVKADLNKNVGNYVEGTYVYATLEAGKNGLTAEDATTFAAASVSGANAVSGYGYVYVKSPSLALVSSSIASVSVATSTLTYNGKADARIKINLTANGGDIYVASGTTNDAVATTTLGASTTVVQSISSNADTSAGGNWVVRSGDTKYFEIYAQITGTDWGATDAAAYAYLTTLKWAITDAGATYISQTWALTDFKTGSVVIEYFR